MDVVVKEMKQMRLTNYTDYSLRVLIYLATKPNEELSNIKEIADVYGISKNHLMKVIYDLGRLGYIETIRGRNGGIRLNKRPEDINIGEVILQTEEDFHLVECFHPEKNSCVISPVCSLKHALNKALEAYISVLKEYTLADFIRNPDAYRELFEK
jgi:Rrf2 family transcriptional regulator, nitric oxide-sensitive transcriptional repressor